MSLARNGGYNPEEVGYILGDNDIHLFFPDGRVYYSNQTSDTESDFSYFVKLDEGIWGAEDYEDYPFVIVQDGDKFNYYANVTYIDLKLAVPFEELKELTLSPTLSQYFKKLTVNGIESEGKPFSTQLYCTPKEEYGVHSFTETSPNRKEFIVGDGGAKTRLIVTPKLILILEETNLSQLSEEEAAEFDDVVKIYD